MHVLMIVPHYLPDLGPSAPLFTMLSLGLVRRGHKVTVLTTVPHYPSGRVSNKYRGKWIRRSSENGVDVLRVALPSVNRAKFTQRLFQFICYQFGATCAGLSLKYDVVFIVNPALWVWLPFVWFVFLRRKPAVFSVYDVYPDVGIKLGIFRHKLVIASVAKFERFCLKYATVVHILSGSFKQGLRKLGVSDDKMALIYPWVDINFIKTLPRDNAFSREYNLTDRFVVLYAGNLGLSQGLDDVLTAAEYLIADSDIQFVFIGDGTAREQLLVWATQRKIANVRFLPFQPRTCLPEVLATADVSLITLRRGVASDSLPSKCFSILASGRPILASVDENSETWKLVKIANAGLCVIPGSPSRLAEAIMALKRDIRLRKCLGENARIWAEQYHSPKSAAEKFEKLFTSAI